jgi:hypothetical protein
MYINTGTQHFTTAKFSSEISDEIRQIEPIMQEHFLK